MRIFFMAVFGGLMVEVIRCYSSMTKNNVFPNEYSNWKFWIIRSLLILGGGVLAIAQQVQTDILAIQIGAAAPAIMTSFSQKALEENPPQP